MTDLPKIQEADDRLWDGFQKTRRIFLGVSIVLALYSWGDANVEKFSFLGGSFVVRDKETFQLLILLIWAVLGWRYWIYEKDVSKKELLWDGRRDSVKSDVVRQMWEDELVREMTPRLKKDLEEIVRPEIEERKKSEDHNIQREFSGAREEESFTILRATLIQSKIRGQKRINGRTHVCYEKDVDLSISGPDNMRAYLKASVSIVATFRPFSDFKGPYLVAALALLGLIRKGMC